MNKEDINRKLVTKVEEFKKHTIDHYKNVLRNRPINEDLKEHNVEKEDLCKKRLEHTRTNKTPDWTKEDVIKVLKGLWKELDLSMTPKFHISLYHTLKLTKG